MLNGASNRLRISGINSQIDTEAMVKAMSMSTHMRINNSRRKVLMLQAQQNAYRDVIAKLQKFQDTYFSVSNQNSFLKATTLFKKTAATVYTKVNGVDTAGTPSGVSVSTAADAKEGTYNVKLITNSTQATLQGGNFSQNVKMDMSVFSGAAVGDKFAFSITAGSSSKNLVVEIETGETAQDAINRVLADTFGKTNAGTGIVSVDSNGVISATDKRAISFTNPVEMKVSQDFALSGLQTGLNTVYVQVGDKIVPVQFKTASDDYFDILFDSGGVLVDDADLEDHLDDVADDRFANNNPGNLTLAQIRAVVKSEYDAKLDEFNQATLKEAYNTWANNPSTTQTEKDQLFDDYFQYRLELQQQERFEASGSTDADWQTWRDNKIAAAVADPAKWDKFFDEEKQRAYDEYVASLPAGTTPDTIADWELGGGFAYANAAALEAHIMSDPNGYGSAFGSESDLYIRFLESSDVEAWRLDRDMFKAASYSEEVAYGQIFGSSPDQYGNTVDSFRSGVSAADAAELFNQQSIKAEFEKITSFSGIKFEVNISAGVATITADDSGTPVDMGFTVAASSPNDFGMTAFEVNSATINKDTKLSDLGINTGTVTINGVGISLSSSMTITQMVDTINKSAAGVTMTFSELDNSFKVVANNYGTAGKVEFGTSANTTNFLEKLCLESGVNGALYTAGTNLEISVNGSIVETASNSYTVDGTTFTFDKSAEVGIEFRVETKSDKGQVVDVIKNFVNDYNKLIEEVFGMLQEKPEKDFYFLTDDDIEESGFSDRQIQQWESQAKKGLLYNNSTVSNVMSGLRMALLTTVTGADGKAFGLMHMRGNSTDLTTGGLTTAIKPSNDYRKNGFLEFDEQALIEALEKNPEDIMKLFTDPDNGIMAKMQKELDRAISTRIIDNHGTREGSLIRMAGTATAASTNNSIYEKIKSLNESITLWNARYERQQDRYWKMFTAMEKQFAGLNSQGDYIANMFSSMMNNNR